MRIFLLLLLSLLYMDLSAQETKNQKPLPILVPEEVPVEQFVPECYSDEINAPYYDKIKPLPINDSSRDVGDWSVFDPYGSGTGCAVECVPRSPICGKYRIPIAITICSGATTEADALAQIADINTYYACPAVDLPFELYSCTPISTDCSGFPSNITSPLSTEVANVLNIIIAPTVNGGSGCNGFAVLPTSPGSANQAVMSGGCFGTPDPDPCTDIRNAQVLIHEIGHFLGLHHTHNRYRGCSSSNPPSAELVDGSNCCTEGDFICDTPADPGIRWAVAGTDALLSGCAVRNADCSITFNTIPQGNASTRFGNNNPDVTWTQGANTFSGPAITGIGQGPLTATVALGSCSISQTIDVNDDLGGPTVSAGTINPPSSCGAASNDGSGTIEVDGCSGPFAFSIAGDGISCPSASVDANGNLSGLCNGQYTVTVTNANGCQTVETITVDDGNRPSPFFNGFTQDLSTCYGPADNAATVDLNLPAGWTASWSHNAGNNTGMASDVPPGQHSVTMISSTGCSYTEEYIIYACCWAGGALEDRYIIRPGARATANCGQDCTDANGDVYMVDSDNIMSYNSQSGCRQSFTECQKTKMVDAFLARSAENAATPDWHLCCLPDPVPPTVASICSDAGAAALTDLVATVTSGTPFSEECFYWWDVAADGTPLATGPDFSPPISVGADGCIALGTHNFWVSNANYLDCGDCESNRIPFSINVTACGACIQACDAAFRLDGVGSSDQLPLNAVTLCIHDADPAMTVTGDVNGTFTSVPAGLSQNAAGAIDVSASIPGTYTVTYTSPNSCAEQLTVIIEPDTDNDLVCDPADACPNDPNKTAAGLCGCGIADTDTDLDGTPDCNDACPNDPNKTVAGVCGCGIAETDTDSDGTPDCNDDCPNDANKTSAGICGCGIADTDTDSDSTPDCNDECPNDPNKVLAGSCGCGVAEGTCADCAGVINGTAAVDLCGVCAGGTTGITPNPDADNDTVPDCLDVCADGDDTVDSDSDGTPDDCDICPFAPLDDCCDASFELAGFSSEPDEPYREVYACEDVPTLSMTGISSTDGLFTATPSGLDLDSQTGAISPSSSTPGTYLLSYEVQEAGPCSEFLTVVIEQNVTTGVSNGLVSTCTELGAAPVDLPAQLNGADGGGFWTETSQTPSLNGIQAGIFDPLGEVPGIYTFEYTILTVDCASSSTTVTVEVLPVCCEANAGTALLNEATCPGDRISVDAAGFNPDSDYNFYYLLVNSSTGLIEEVQGGQASAVASSISFVYATPGTYMVFLLSEQAGSGVLVTPAAGQLLTDISVGADCFDLRQVGTATNIPAPFASIGGQSNSSEGEQGNILPAYYNYHQILLQGGTPPYSYDFERTGYVRWSLDSATDPDYDQEINLVYADDAEWSVTITDANGCTDTQLIFTNDSGTGGGNASVNTTGDILDIDDFAITPESIDSGGNNGSIELSVTGCGGGPYSYIWSGPGDFTGASRDIYGLVSGFYEVTVSCADQETHGFYWVPKDRRSGRLKSSLELDVQAHPNPFFVNTRIGFTARAGAQTSLFLYDTNGKLVKTLYNEFCDRQREVSMALSAENLSTGVYLLRLESAGLSQSMRLVLMD